MEEIFHGDVRRVEGRVVRGLGREREGGGGEGGEERISRRDKGDTEKDEERQGNGDR